MSLTCLLDPLRGLSKRGFVNGIEQRRGNGPLHVHVTGIVDAAAGRMPVARYRWLHVPMTRHIFKVRRLVVVQRESQTALGRKERMIIVRFKLECGCGAAVNVGT
jgi:hypothetical protein